MASGEGGIGTLEKHYPAKGAGGKPLQGRRGSGEFCQQRMLQNGASKQAAISSGREIFKWRFAQIIYRISVVRALKS